MSNPNEFNKMMEECGMIPASGNVPLPEEKDEGISITKRMKLIRKRKKNLRRVERESRKRNRR